VGESVISRLAGGIVSVASPALSMRGPKRCSLFGLVVLRLREHGASCIHIHAYTYMI
jgi:hypothetical protein